MNDFLDIDQQITHFTEISQELESKVNAIYAVLTALKACVETDSKRIKTLETTELVPQNIHARISNLERLVDLLSTNKTPITVVSKSAEIVPEKIEPKVEEPVISYKEKMEFILSRSTLYDFARTRCKTYKTGKDSYMALCPFEKNPDFKHFEINAKSNLWNCSSCKESGDLIGFAKKYYSGKNQNDLIHLLYDHYKNGAKLYRDRVTGK